MGGGAHAQDEAGASTERRDQRNPPCSRSMSSTTLCCCAYGPVRFSGPLLEVGASTERRDKKTCSRDLVRPVRVSYRSVRVIGINGLGVYANLRVMDLRVAVFTRNSLLRATSVNMLAY